MSAIDLAYHLAGIKAALWTLVALLAVCAAIGAGLALLALRVVGVAWTEFLELFGGRDA